MMKTLLFIFCMTVFQCLHLKADQLPNILILYADDMGYGDLAIQNPDSKIPTPHLDQLAREGMRFTDAHSSSGICTPSRYALLTGTHHWRRFHGIVEALGKPVFKDGELTMAGMLREKGYDTACIGKWHLGWDWDAIRRMGEPADSISFTAFDWSKPVPGGPLARGFDYYFGDDVINFPPYAWIQNDRLLTYPDSDLTLADMKAPPKEGRWELRSGPAVSDWDFYNVLPALSGKAVDYIRSQKGSDRPFFLYVALPSPHAPIIPNDAYDNRSDAGPYGDFVVETDETCGRILEALDQIGAKENTIVIFSSDNGPELYAYARDETFGHWSSNPFRGLKRDIYEGGHHVPMLLRWPGLIEAGTVSEALLSQVDLVATLAAVVGYELPECAALDSFNFLPYLQGESANPPRQSHVHNTFENAYAIRSGKWLLINAETGIHSRRDPEELARWEERHDYSGDSLPVELYDMENDPGQRNNLAGEYPDHVTELQALLNQIRQQGYSAPRLANKFKTCSPAKPEQSP